MMEQEWLACSDPQKMLDLLRSRGKHSLRKFRLFAVACCRKITSLMLKTKYGYRGVIIAERLADGLPVEEKLEEFRNHLFVDYDFCRIDCEAPPTKLDAIIHSAGGAAYHSLDEESAFLDETELTGGPGISQVIYRVAMAVTHWARRTDWAWPKEAVHRRQIKGLVPVVHEVFGNPFRPPILDPRWLTWQEATIPRLARAIYDEWAFDRLPILADALEEAGCHASDILAHCRQPGDHVRGCWAVDAILGKT